LLKVALNIITLTPNPEDACTFRSVFMLEKWNMCVWLDVLRILFFPCQPVDKWMPKECHPIKDNIVIFNSKTNLR
jgi:hypothetical protein